MTTPFPAPVSPVQRLAAGEGPGVVEAPAGRPERMEADVGEDVWTSIRVAEFDCGPLHELDLVVPTVDGKLPGVVVTDEGDFWVTYVLMDDQGPRYRYVGSADGGERLRCPRYRGNGHWEILSRRQDVSDEEALTALVRSCRGAGYTAAQTTTLGAHYVAEVPISGEVHERVWRAEGLYPEVDDTWQR